MKHIFEPVRRWWRHFILRRRQPKTIANPLYADCNEALPVSPPTVTDFSEPADPEPDPIAAALELPSMFPNPVITPDMSEIFANMAEQIREAGAAMAKAIEALMQQARDAASGLGLSLPKLLQFDQHATPEEIHRMEYSRKFRTRNKYKNRILRRIRNAEKRGHRHDQEAAHRSGV